MIWGCPYFRTRPWTVPTIGKHIFFVWCFYGWACWPTEIQLWHYSQQPVCGNISSSWLISHVNIWGWKHPQPHRNLPANQYYPKEYVQIIPFVVVHLNLTNGNSRMGSRWQVLVPCRCCWFWLYLHDIAIYILILYLCIYINIIIYYIHIIIHNHI